MYKKRFKKTNDCEKKKKKKELLESNNNPTAE
jgi:hypothetical protein